MTDDTTPDPNAAPSRAPAGAVPAEQLLPGLRGHLEKGEHVLWQGRGGRALDAFDRGFLLRVGILALAVVLLITLMLNNPNHSYDWVAWVLGGLLLARAGLYMWQLSKLPSRQVAMLTTQRVVSIDMLRPMATWIIARGGKGRADGVVFEPHPIIVTGTKERGHIRLNRASKRTHAYPPFILFSVERPLDLAARIRKTLAITTPVEDRTK